jgi:hypothetical protein
MNKVFCIGNGESRKGFDLSSLKSHGKIYGCNALYREFTPDVLISVDNGIMHEIYHTGYGINNICYFRDWTRVPELHYYSLIYEGLSKKEIELIKKWDVHRENPRPEGSFEFVMHGSQLEGIAKIVVGFTLDTNEMIIKEKLIKQNQLSISWCHPKDKVENISDVMEGDLGFSAGSSAVWLSVKKEKPTMVFLLGYDISTINDKVNNLYKNTKNYLASWNKHTHYENWLQQLKTTFLEHPEVQFYKVNSYQEPQDQLDQVNKQWAEWDGIKNLHYITYNALDKMLKL